MVRLDQFEGPAPNLSLCMEANMRVIETHHFLAQWASRVGKYYPRLRKLVLRSIVRGEARRHRRPELGILVPIEHTGKILCVVGIPTRKEFILRTVLPEDMACRMGWNRC